MRDDGDDIIQILRSIGTLCELLNELEHDQCDNVKSSEQPNRKHIQYYARRHDPREYTTFPSYYYS